MTKQEMLKLKAGDRVKFISDGVGGTVVASNKHCVTFDWDDGQKNLSISVEDSSSIEVEAEA